jgi:glycosyltransferase involved in cell wall biosynthesis
VFHRPTVAEIAAVTARLGLRGGPYVAYLGSLAARKNVEALVQGWAGAVADLPVPPALVLAGGGGWSDEVDAAIAHVPPELKVVRPGYLPFRDLAGFFGGAQVVAFPSRGEGAGLPVLEAMACGAPVLTTLRSSLSEVGGDAVAYTEPDAASIGAALRDLLSAPSKRAALGSAGYVRSQEFTWAASASAHLASYKRAAEDGLGGTAGGGRAREGQAREGQAGEGQAGAGVPGPGASAAE